MLLPRDSSWRSAPLFPRGVVSFSGRLRRFQYSQRRLQNIFPSASPFIQRGKTDSTNRGICGGPAQRGYYSSGKEGHRSGSRSSKTQRLLQHLLSGPKKDWGPQTYFELKTLQSEDSDTNFQNGVSGKHHSVSMSRRMAGISRPKRCLPPHTNTPQSLQMAKVLHSGSLLSVESPSIRPVYGSSGFHKSVGSCVGFNKAEGYSYTPISRRFVTEGFFSSEASLVDSAKPANSNSGRLHCKSRKIRFGTNSGSHV